jgi:hypothetical protein
LKRNASQIHTARCAHSVTYTPQEVNIMGSISYAIPCGSTARAEVAKYVRGTRAEVIASNSAPGDGCNWGGTYFAAHREATGHSSSSSPLMANPRDVTTCTVCGTRLIRHWTPNGMDFAWLDETGSNRSGCGGGPGGTGSIEDYLAWLRDHDIGGYSLFLARVTLGAGILPWQHWHQPSLVAVAASDAREWVPWCCGEPARRIRDGWICREDPHHRPPSGQPRVAGKFDAQVFT